MKTLLTLVVALGFSMMVLPAQAGGSIERGKKIAAEKNCASCHGADFNTVVLPESAKLAGQHADYLAVALRAYQRPDTKLGGRKNAMMQGFAAQLSEQDILDLSAYLSSLPGSLVIK